MNLTHTFELRRRRGTFFTCASYTCTPPPKQVEKGYFLRSMPHFEHTPGLSDVTSGCIGHAYLSFNCGVDVRVFFTSDIPHSEHFPGLAEVTSGCIGQAYTHLVPVGRDFSTPFFCVIWSKGTLTDPMARTPATIPTRRAGSFIVLSFLLCDLIL